jgi:chemotaxis protein CheZ
MSSDQASANVHYKIGVLTRQLHNSLNELGYADRLRGSAGSFPMRKAACPISPA